MYIGTSITTGETLSDATILSELGVGSDQPVTLVVQPAISPPSFHLGSHLSSHGNEKFTTHVRVGDEVKEILINIERAKLKKPFLGGYRHKLTGIEYHNASAQTLPKPHPRKVSIMPHVEVSIMPRVE